MNDCFEVLKYSQDRNPASHFHEEYEILISLTNDGKFFVREHGYPLRFGTMFVLPPFEIHRCFCKGAQNYERYTIHFPAELLRQMSTPSVNMEKVFGSVLHICQVPDELLMNMILTLSGLLKEKTGEFGEEIERKIQLEKALLLAARLIESQDEVVHPCIESDGRVGEVLQYIHANYANDITLEKMANDLFISKSRLSQIFKDATGFSIGSYIIVYRIKRACSLLQSGMSVQESGERVGFHNGTHFIRAFKRHMGCSPGKFVRKKEEREKTENKGDL